MTKQYRTMTIESATYAAVMEWAGTLRNSATQTEIIAILLATAQGQESGDTE
jgi:hypothetical protein